MKKFFSKMASSAASALGSAYAFLLAVTGVLIWALTGPLFHFSETWQLVINTSTTIITFLSVFLIQNSQNRESKAMQLKLDELIMTFKEARNDMIDVENLSDEELEKFGREFKKFRAQNCGEKQAAQEAVKETVGEGPDRAVESGNRNS